MAQFSQSVLVEPTTGSIQSISLTSDSTFTASTVPLIHIPSPTSGVQAKAHVNLDSSGNIESVSIDEPGSGYDSTNPPTATIINGYTPSVNLSIEQSISKIHSSEVHTQHIYVSGDIVNPSLSTSLTDIQGDIMSLEGRIADLESVDNTTDDRLDDHEARLGVAESEIDTLQGRVDGHDTRLDEADDIFNNINIQIGDIEARVGTLEISSTDYESRLTGHDEYLENLNNNVNDHMNRIGDIESNLNSAFDFTPQGQFNVLEQVIFNTDVNCMGGLHIQNTDLDVMDGDVVIQNRPVLVELDTLADGMSFKADKTTTDDHETRIGDLEESSEDYSARIGTLENHDVAKTSQIQELQDTTGDHENRIGSLEDKTQDFEITGFEIKPVAENNCLYISNKDVDNKSTYSVFSHNNITTSQKLKCSDVNGNWKHSFTTDIGGKFSFDFEGNGEEYPQRSILEIDSQNPSPLICKTDFQVDGNFTSTITDDHESRIESVEDKTQDVDLTGYEIRQNPFNNRLYIANKDTANMPNYHIFTHNNLWTSQKMIRSDGNGNWKYSSYTDMGGAFHLDFEGFQDGPNVYPQRSILEISSFPTPSPLICKTDFQVEGRFLNKDPNGNEHPFKAIHNEQFTFTNIHSTGFVQTFTLSKTYDIDSNYPPTAMALNGDYSMNSGFWVLSAVPLYNGATPTDKINQVACLCYGSNTNQAKITTSICFNIPPM